ncbi:MAG: AmmeMemoRadiSam system radical SAM enzyme [Candidatus Ratteibacteria bacterium]|nr:AmmeMemoRadiSam system radical SAM enzyme [Candidatus Ratteibacteria bacterium]
MKKNTFVIFLIFFFLFFFLFSGKLLAKGLKESFYGLFKLKEASFYKKLDKKAVSCLLCPRRCRIPEGERGFCRVRLNKGGKLFTITYGCPCAVHIDPVEKKPLFHVLPGSAVFSIASAGCNLKCKFCQNWTISQTTPEYTYNYNLPPEEVVAAAKRKRCLSIAYTYTEPTSFYEYMLDTAKAARKQGVFNLFHSCGYINPEPLRKISQYLDAGNVDLKGFSGDFYQKACSAELQPVLETLKILKEEGVWIEITNLVIPTLNDESGLIKEMCLWIRDNLGEDVPLHFSRFHPDYKMRNLPPTPLKTLEHAHRTAKEAGLKYVYIGNVPGHPAENTYCPKCGKILIERRGYTVLQNNIKEGCCKFCREPIAGIWSKK